MFLRSVLIQTLRNFKRFNAIKIYNSFGLQQNVNISNLSVKKSSFDTLSVKPVWRWDILTTILIFFGVIEDLEKKDSPLVLEIKRGILARTRRQYLKADRHFHAALKMAQDQEYSDAETYIFDCMADNFLEQDEFIKARDLYLEVIRRLADKLKSNELVEISCKLAHCYSNTGDHSNAEIGFQFAIDTIQPETQTFYSDKDGSILVEQLSDEQKNCLALLGLCYDYYSKHLEDINLKYSLSYKLKALKISEIVNGKNEQQTLVLHNDIASIYAQMKEYELAKSNLSTAIDGAKEIELSELPFFYVNLAAVYHQQKRLDLAKQQCGKAQDFLLKYKTSFTQIELNELLSRCENCLKGHKFY